MPDLIDNVRNFKNVKIVNIPIFMRYYIKLNQLYCENLLVSEIYTDTIKYIKSNDNKVFYIFQIEENFARWTEVSDIEHLKENRKEKLKKLEKL